MNNFDKKITTIFVTGPNGSGKTTTMEELSDEFELQIIAPVFFGEPFLMTSFDWNQKAFVIDEVSKWDLFSLINQLPLIEEICHSSNKKLILIADYKEQYGPLSDILRNDRIFVEFFDRESPVEVYHEGNLVSFPEFTTPQVFLDLLNS